MSDEMARAGGTPGNGLHPLWLHGKGATVEFDLQLEFKEPPNRKSLNELKSALIRICDNAADAIDAGNL
jgi:hypothetical protein